MFPLNSSQRAAFEGFRHEFEQAIGVPREMPKGVAFFDLDDSLLVEIDMPGVSRSDVDLTLEKDVLRVRAERKTPEVEANAGQDFRSYGEIEHVFRLGFAVDPSGVDAVCENGVLRITLPKASEEQPQRIEVRDRPDSQN